MANPTSMAATDYAVVLQATTTAQSIALDAQFSYQVTHNGETNDAAPSANTNTIYLTFNNGTSVTATGAEGTNKCKLTSGRSIIIGPGINELGYQLYTSASGTPTFDIVRADNYLGKF